MTDEFEQKHSPGPWKNINGFILSKDEECVCEMPRYYTGVLTDRRSADEHLVAAAPELLEVVFNVCALGDGMDSGTWPEVLADARKALDKAEGNQ